MRSLAEAFIFHLFVSVIEQKKTPKPTSKTHISDGDRKIKALGKALWKNVLKNITRDKKVRETYTYTYIYILLSSVRGVG